MKGKIVWILYDYVFSFMWNIETCDLRFYFCKLIIWDHFGLKVNKASKLRSCKWSYERYNCSHGSPVHYLDWLSWKCAELWVNYSAQFFSVFTLVCHNKQLGVELMWHDCSNSLEAFHACYTSSFFCVSKSFLPKQKLRPSWHNYEQMPKLKAFLLFWLLPLGAVTESHLPPSHPFPCILFQHTHTLHVLLH